MNTHSARSSTTHRAACRPSTRPPFELIFVPCKRDNTGRWARPPTALKLPVVRELKEASFGGALRGSTSLTSRCLSLPVRCREADPASGQGQNSKLPVGHGGLLTHRAWRHSFACRSRRCLSQPESSRCAARVAQGRWRHCQWFDSESWSWPWSRGVGTQREQRQ